MTAFLFIPSNNGLNRRVDLAHVASLFSEAEEPPRTPATSRLALRAAAAALLVLLAFGDTVLVNQPSTLSACASPPTLVGEGRAASL